MQATRLYLVDVGYGRGFLDDAGRTVALNLAHEWAWSQALDIVLKLRKRGYTGAEAVPVTVVSQQTELVV